MDRDQFWYMIAVARHGARNRLEKQMVLIGDVLRTRPPSDILSFQQHLYIALRAAYTSHLLATATIALGECDEAAFAAFRGWMVMQGDAANRKGIENPETLLEPMLNYVLFDSVIQCAEIEFLAESIYKEVTGLDDFWEQYEAEYGPNPPLPPLELDWENTPESLEGLFPVLYDRFRR